MPELGEDRDRSHPPGCRSLGGPPGRGIGDIHVAANVLHIEGDQSQSGDVGGSCKCAGSEAGRGEAAVEDLNASGPRAIGGVELVLGLIDGQAGEYRARYRRLHEGRRSGVPGRDGAVQVAENEIGVTAIAAVRDQEAGRIAAIDLPGRSLGSARRGWNHDQAAGRIDVDLGDVGLSCHRIKRGGVLPLVGDPEWAGGAMRKAPWVHQRRIGDDRKPGDVRNQVGLNVRARQGGCWCGYQNRDSNRPISLGRNVSRQHEKASHTWKAPGARLTMQISGRTRHFNLINGIAFAELSQCQFC